jgi:hypothetical protein
MLEIARGRNFLVVHTITDDGVTPSNLLEDTGDGPLPIAVRCQLRGTAAVRNPRSRRFELPLLAEINAALSGDTGEFLTLSLSATATDALELGSAVLDAVGIWSDHEEVLLPPEPVKITLWPTTLIGAPVFAPEDVLAVPDFVDDFTDALED